MQQHERRDPVLSGNDVRPGCAGNCEDLKQRAGSRECWQPETIAMVGTEADEPASRGSRGQSMSFLRASALPVPAQQPRAVPAVT
jgi:hypothetical protein